VDMTPHVECQATVAFGTLARESLRNKGRTQQTFSPISLVSSQPSG
jgi:hypothetical protein